MGCEKKKCNNDKTHSISAHGKSHQRSHNYSVTEDFHNPRIRLTNRETVKPKIHVKHQHHVRPRIRLDNFIKVKPQVQFSRRLHFKPKFCVKTHVSWCKLKKEHHCL